MNYSEFYNCKVGTIFHRKSREWKLVKKEVKEFGELRMILKGGPSVKPIFIFWDEYDYDEWFDLMRTKP